jgi:hypothetical protein
MRYVERPLLMSPRSSSSGGPTVNKVLINPNNLTHTVPPSNLAPAQRVQPTARMHVPFTHCTISRSSNVLQNTAPVSSSCGGPVPSSSRTQSSRPSCSNIIQKNVVSGVETRDISASDDDDIVEVFSTLQNLTDEQNAAFEFMMKTLTKTYHTSRILAYHMEVLQQKLKHRNKKTEMTPKSVSHLAGKLYRLLKKASKSLNLQREFLSKEFSDWLDGERTKRGIPTSEEREASVAAAKDKASDAETTREPELLLDMEISCESDYEDVSGPSGGVCEEQIEFSKKLSDSDTDSDDPFSDSGMSKYKNLRATFRPFHLCTVKDLLRDKFSSKLLLQALTEQRSKTADSENKQIPSSKELQPRQAQARTAVPGKDELTVQGKEYNVSTLPEQISNSGNLSLHSSHIDIDSGNENEKLVRVKSADRISEAIRDSPMESSSGRINNMTGNEGSRTHETCNSSGTESADLICEPVNTSPNAVSPSRSDKIMDDESCSGKAACSDSRIECVDPGSESAQNSPAKSSCSDTDDKTENEGSQNKTPCRDNKTNSGDAISEAVENSLTDIFTATDKSGNGESHRNKNPCKSSERASVEPVHETAQNSSTEISPSRTDNKTDGDETHRNKTPFMQSEAESVDPVSEAVHNSLIENSPRRIDDDTGSEECGQGETPLKHGGIDSINSFDTDTETNDICVDKPIRKQTASRGRRNDVSRKRKYEHMSSNDDKANFCGFAGRAANTTRTDCPSTDCSSSSSVIVPVTELQKTEATVNDFTTMVHSAVQKKIIKPCFVSVVKFSRYD